MVQTCLRLTRPRSTDVPKGTSQGHVRVFRIEQWVLQPDCQGLNPIAIAHLAVWCWIRHFTSLVPQFLVVKWGTIAVPPSKEAARMTGAHTPNMLSTRWAPGGHLAMPASLCYSEFSPKNGDQGRLATWRKNEP